MQHLIAYQKTVHITITEFKILNDCPHYTFKVSEKDKTHFINKTSHQIKCFHNDLSKSIFQLEQPFQQSIFRKEDPENVIKGLSYYLKTLCDRIDVLSNKVFRRFFELNLGEIARQLQLIRLENQIDMESQNLKVSYLLWQPIDDVIFTIQTPKNKIAKISNLFKSLLAKQNQTGLITAHKLNKGFTWQKKFQIQISQSEPICMKWSRKSTMLTVATECSIYVFRISTEQNYSKYDMLAFCQMMDFVDMCIHELCILTYIITKSTLNVYSLKQQTMRRSHNKGHNMTALTIQQKNQRLYVSDTQVIHIYDIQQKQFPKQIHKIPVDCSYTTLLIGGYKHQYLFGLCKKGFVSVFQLKPRHKQNLINILTNIQCPQNSSYMVFSTLHQCLLTDYRSNLLMINSKNIPLFSLPVGGKSTEKVYGICYDEIKDKIVVGNQSEIVTYLVKMPEQKIVCDQ